MTPNEAKKTIKYELDKRGLTYTKLSAKTVSFQDLARCSRVFVNIEGWKPCGAWSELQEVAKAYGFYITHFSS